jgi:hypothetical protein
MLSNVQSFKVLTKYCISIINVPSGFNSLSIVLTISSILSECAKTLEAKIKSAFSLIFFKTEPLKKLLIVLILFLFAALERFFAGSIPITFLYPLSIKGFNAIPSLDPISIISASFFNLSFLI